MLRQAVPDHQPRATGDFETRSAASIRLGGWVYSLDPTTEVMCFAFRLPYWEAGRTALWHPAYPHLGIEEEGREELEELFDWIRAGGLFEAHNAFFERAIWTNICTPLLGWPEVPRGQWRCSAAKASANSLPRSMEGCAKALHLPAEKDMEGRRLMLRLCKPRKLSRAERDARSWRSAGTRRGWIAWHESAEEFERLWLYCRRDVLTEEAISEALPDLSDVEQRVWLMDQDMNVRGVRFDLGLAKAALSIASTYKDRLNLELSDITDGEVRSATQRETFKVWIRGQGVELPDTQGSTLERVLAMSGLRPDLAHALFVMGEVNKTSTAKYQAMLERCTPGDHRARDLLMFCGAGTGRWTGKNIQVHNFPKGEFTSDLAIRVAVEAIKAGDVDLLVALYGPKVMEVLSWALRGSIVPSDGRELHVADFSAIEARVVLWLARQMSAMAIFEAESAGTGHGIYCDMSTGIYGRPITKKDKTERQFGKQAILGLGFEMGFVKFLITCRKYKIGFTVEQVRAIVGADYAEHEEKIRKLHDVPSRLLSLADARMELEAVMHELVLMRFTVITYRERYPEVPAMWRDQEAAAIAAVRAPGRVVEVERGRNAWVVEGMFLRNYLPSGRPLSYPDPLVLKKAVPWDKQDRRPVLTFMTQTKANTWARAQTYGGSLVENLTQATAREIMAQAMVRADDDPRLDVAMSVHDELVAEADVGAVSVPEFQQIMTVIPEWARGCPIDADAWVGPRYRK